MTLETIVDMGDGPVLGSPKRAIWSVPTISDNNNG
jgi:hypothetical protein